jgi:hypothetical protein
MVVNLGKFVHTETGRTIMSILLGFGLASFFRKICKDKECIIFHAPSLDDFKDKIYMNDAGKCVKYKPLATKCSINSKIIDFE